MITGRLVDGLGNMVIGLQNGVARELGPTALTRHSLPSPNFNARHLALTSTSTLPNHANVESFSGKKRG